MSGAAVIALTGCGEQDSSSKQVEVIDTGTGEQIVSTEVATPAVQEATTPSTSVQPSEAGSYTLKVGDGTITLVAKEASRQAIVKDIASQIGMEVLSNGSVDVLVSSDLDSVSMSTLLNNLFSDTAYFAGYGKKLNNKGFRINNLTIGSSVASVASADTQIDTSSAIELPQSSGEIFLGSDPDEVDLTQRLQFGSPEDRAIAVSELMMDPAGFNAAYQIFERDNSPEVRLAVLELIESEDYFLARQMVVASLQDPNKEIILYALGIVDSLSDFSLVPQVELLMSHYDSEVAEYAKEVRESLTSGYFDPNEQ
ncbi:MAG: hypothetical protein ACR2QW_13660 [bacterium]